MAETPTSDSVSVEGKSADIDDTCELDHASGITNSEGSSGQSKEDEVNKSTGSHVHELDSGISNNASNYVDEESGVSYSACSYGPEEDATAKNSTGQVMSSDPYTKDVCDTHAVAGQCGLYNLGNTCFMNSGLQSMLSTTPLLKYFLDRYLEIEKINKDSELVQHFIYLTCKYWSGSFSIIYPREFKNALGIQHSQFQDYRQHDCQEFLALLLDTLHEQIIKLEQSGFTGSDSQPCDHNLSDTDGIEQELNNSMRTLTDSDSESHQEIREPDGEGDHSFCRLDWKHITLPNNKSGIKDTLKSPIKLIDDHIAHTDNIHRISELSSLGKSSSHNKDELETPCKNLQSVLNNAVHFKQKLPLFEQFYSKDTKTLNTNMLVNEYTEDPLAVDSEKFSKPDNTNVQDTSMEVNLASIANEPIHMNVESTKDGSPAKGLKDTNIWADKRNKITKMCSDDLYSDERNVDSDNIKRMRFEKTEKNLQQQEFSRFSKSNFQIISTGNCDENLQECKKVNDTSDVTCLPEDEYQDNSDDETASVNEISEDFAGLQQCDEEVSEADIEAAEKAWDAYIKQHKQSIIVDTFQGQFKSTVICSVCNHVSVTYEPFMYLSVPLPHAAERQICVVFMSQNSQSTQYLFTMNKNDKIAKVKQEIRSAANIGQSQENTDCDIVMAEVLRNHISRILEDNVLLRYVNDSTRKIYAFEVKLCKLENIPNESEVNKNSSSVPVSDVFSGMTMFSTTDIQKTSTFNQDFGLTNTIENTSLEPQSETGSNMEAPLVSGIESCKILPENTSHTVTIEQGMTQSADNLISDFIYDRDYTIQEMATPSMNQSQDNTYHCEENDYQGQENAYQSQEKACISDVYMQDITQCDTEDNTQSVQWSSEADRKFVSEDVTLISSWDWSMEEKQEETDFSSLPQWEATVETTSSVNTNRNTSPITTSVTMIDQWKSCAICLEELSDPELLVHTHCKGTFCQSCLEMSFKHYGSEIFCCPVCSTPAVMTEDFLPLTDNCDQLTQIRVILVEVSFLTESDDTNGRHLFGHPRLLYLPSHMDAKLLYQYLASVVPIEQEYNIRFTDGQGLQCSRCSYSSHCLGCLVPKEGEVTLRPGDHLTVCYNNLSSEMCQAAEKYESDQSMEQLRPDKPLSIYDCIKAFTDSEILDEQNPWFCPSCQRNQCARKTMTVWQYPDTLIIQLKRFMYHDLSSTKVDCQVIFPLENLDLGQFISGPTSSSLQYDLYSIICHFGGATAGHYTAFNKHPLDGNWYYYNDETVTQQAPSHSDYNNAYILFYQRQGTEVNFDIPSKIKTLTMDKLPALCQSQNQSICAQVEEKSDIPALA